MGMFILKLRCSPAEFARVVLPHGVTTVIADPHEIANVGGASAIEYMLAATENLPLTVYLTLPSCVPCSPLEQSGATLTAEQLAILPPRTGYRPRRSDGLSGGAPR